MEKDTKKLNRKPRVGIDDTNLSLGFGKKQSFGGCIFFTPSVRGCIGAGGNKVPFEDGAFCIKDSPLWSKAVFITLYTGGKDFSDFCKSSSTTTEEADETYYRAGMMESEAVLYLVVSVGMYLDSRGKFCRFRRCHLGIIVHYNII